MGPGGCNDCLAPAYGYVAVRCAAEAGIHRNLANGQFGPRAVTCERPVSGNQYGGLSIPKVISFRSRIAHLDPLSPLALKQLQTGS